jgi:hypothetical protein
MGMMVELNKRIREKIPSVVSMAIQPTYTWETAVGYLSHCADNEVGGPIGMMYYKLPMPEQIDSIAPVKNYLNENLEHDIKGVDMYITLTTKGNYKYSSDNDVLVWNSIGYSEIRLGEEKRTLEPGDLFYIPAGIEYEYKPTTARAYIVFAL